MGDKSKIEWCDATWNPVTGCTKVSQGCKNCYAEGVANRFWGERKFTDVQCHEDRLDQPLRWKKPRRIFVNSMSDLFHPDVPFDFIDKVFAVMGLAKQHTFMILTKRPERMLAYFERTGDVLRRDWVVSAAARLLNKNKIDFPDFPLNNVYLGVSVETQKEADERIPLLLKTPAAVRFVSCEPLLGSLDLKRLIGQFSDCPECGYNVSVDEDGLCTSCGRDIMHYGVDWVIVGGESGPHARPMHPDWVRSIRDQCVDAGTSFFFKQWGEWQPICEMEDGQSEKYYYPPPKRDPEAIRRCKVPTAIVGYDGELKDDFWSVEDHVCFLTFKVGKKKAGRILDGQEWNGFPREVGE